QTCALPIFAVPLARRDRADRQLRGAGCHRDPHGLRLRPRGPGSAPGRRVVLRAAPPDRLNTERSKVSKAGGSGRSHPFFLFQREPATRRRASTAIAKAKKTAPAAR